MDLLREAVSKYHSLKRDGLVGSDSPARTPATSTQLDATPCAPPTIDALTLLPPELLVSTLASCDNFDDVLSLVSTSKRLHQVYLENVAQVIWPVAVRSFLAFDHAVLAVRVTKKATDAYHAARLPERADLTIDKLSPFRRAPTVSELRDAFALDHFGQCFLDILKSNSAEQLMSEGEEQDGITDKSIWHTVWSKTLRYSSERRGSDLLRRLAMERIIRALYRTVIWGAVMSRAYQEPLFDAAVNGLDNLAETWTYSVSGDGAQLQQNGSSKTGPQLSAQDIRHLSKYPAYRGFNLAHFSPYTKDETSEFSSITDWLIRDMIQIEELETFMQRTDSRTMEKRTHALPVRDQVAQVAWVYQVLSNIIVDRKGRLRALRNPRLPFVASGYHGFSEAASTPVVRKLTLILPGMYQPEEITMPATVGDMIEIPSLDGAAARFSGVKKFTRLLFVAEPTIKNPCGIRMDGEGRYIAFPSLLSCASDSALTHKDIEIRPLASILYKHLQHRAPARFLTNIMFNNTSRGESWEYDALHAGVRWYNPPRKAKQVVEQSEEAEESEAMDVEEAEEVKEELEAMKEEESKGEGEMEEMDKMELDADCEEK